MTSRILLFLFLLTFLCTEMVEGQSINTEFGKNRVQYHDDQYNWSRYETENFMTYWYGKSRNIAQTVIQLAELDHSEIQKVLEHTLSHKIEIIVYTDLSDMKQSNIGLDDAFTNNHGETVVQGDKMMVYFDGNHLHLRRQIREGIAHIYMNSILFGTSLQEIVQNALLLNLPPWFTDGIISYSGNEWDSAIDDELRDLLDTKGYNDFEKLAKDHPRVAGYSMWNYIDKTYGSATIANIIYLTRISRSLENSFLFIIGVEFDDIKEDWFTYYLNNYEGEANNLFVTSSLDKVKLKNKKGVPISHMRLSPDGSHLAYITNDRGKNRLFLRNLETGKEKKWLTVGTKNLFQEPDYSYPLITWHPRYPELTVLYEHRDVLKLLKIDVKNDSYEKDDFTTNFQRVYSIDYIRPDEYILTAATDGYSDLYHYQSDKRNHTRITEDFYDDLDARVINYKGSPAVLFRSNREGTEMVKNRLDTILPVKNFDLYVLKGFDKNATLEQLTYTPHINEQQAYQSDSDKIIYLHDRTGILNAYAYDIYTGQSESLTNLERNIITHHTNPKSDQHFFNYYYDGNYDSFVKSKTEVSATQPYVTKNGLAVKKRHQNIIVPFLPQEGESVKLTEGMKFQSPFDDPEVLAPINDTDVKAPSNSLFDKYFKDYFSDSYQDGRRIIKFNPMRASATRERFRLDDFTSKADNAVLFEGLESYTGDDKELNNVPIGMLLKADIKDLFEDYEITIGTRIPFRLNGYEYFVTIDDNKHLWDRRFAIYRKSNTEIKTQNSNILLPTVTTQKRHAFVGLYRLKYPFDVYQSLRFTGSLRFDKLFSQVTDDVTFRAPFNYEKRLSLRAEYVFDNAFDVSMNIKNGSRAKVYSEVINEFDLELSNGFNVDASKALTGIFGFDARHYIPVFKRAVLALRAAGATSFGSKRIIYYLGGVDGNIPLSSASAEENIPVPESSAYAYKVLAPNLRGFKNNIRNGNSFLLANTEFRFPVFQFLGLGQIKMAFLRNMQLAGFFDAGMAWYGFVPNSEDSPLNSITVSNPPNNPIITIEARYFRDPLVYGYGFGMHTTFLGYFIKADYAWGVETAQKTGGRLFLSLGLDF